MGARPSGTALLEAGPGGAIRVPSWRRRAVSMETAFNSRCKLPAQVCGLKESRRGLKGHSVPCSFSASYHEPQTLGRFKFLQLRMQSCMKSNTWPYLYISFPSPSVPWVKTLSERNWWINNLTNMCLLPRGCIWDKNIFSLLALSWSHICLDIKQQ